MLFGFAGGGSIRTKASVERPSIATAMVRAKIIDRSEANSGNQVLLAKKLRELPARHEGMAECPIVENNLPSMSPCRFRLINRICPRRYVPEVDQVQPPAQAGWLDLTDRLSFVTVRYHVTFEQFLGFQMAELA